MKFGFMVPIYVLLIKMGIRTIDSVPEVLRDRVREALGK